VWRRILIGKTNFYINNNTKGANKNEKEFLSLMGKYYEYKFNRNLKIENQKRKR